MQMDPPQSRTMSSLLEAAGKYSQNINQIAPFLNNMQGGDREAQKDYSKKREQEVFDSHIANKGQKKGTKR